MDKSSMRRTTCARIPTAEGEFQLCHYVDSRDGKEHLALVMGDVWNQQSVLVRVHSECFTGDVMGSQRCDCGEQLRRAMRMIAETGAGVILYLRQEGRGIGLEQKLNAYNLQDRGYDTVDANLLLGHQADEREYSAAAFMLQDLGVQSIRLLTNNPAKLDHLAALEIEIENRVPLLPTVTSENAAYLAAKAQRMRHMLNLPGHADGMSRGAGRTDEFLQETQLAKLKERMAAAAPVRPFVTVSYAQTINGAIATPESFGLQISGPAALRLTHRLRSIHDAILVGIGTVLADDPQLTVRLIEGESPQPVVIDSRFQLPPDARLWKHPKPPWIATLAQEDAVNLNGHAARILTMPSAEGGGVHLPSLLDGLYQSGIRSVMVEGGSRIITSLLAHKLVDYLVITIAPRLEIGLNVLSPKAVEANIGLTAVEFTRAGDDLILWGGVETGHPLAAIGDERIRWQPALT